MRVYHTDVMAVETACKRGWGWGVGWGYLQDASGSCGVDEAPSSAETESGQNYGSDSPGPTKSHG